MIAAVHEATVTTGAVADSSTLRSSEQIVATVFGGQMMRVEADAVIETNGGSLITGGLDLLNRRLKPCITHEKNLRTTFGRFVSLLGAVGDGETVGEATGGAAEKGSEECSARFAGAKNKSAHPNTIRLQ